MERQPPPPPPDQTYRRETGLFFAVVTSVGLAIGILAAVAGVQLGAHIASIALPSGEAGKRDCASAASGRPAGAAVASGGGAPREAR